LRVAAGKPDRKRAVRLSRRRVHRCPRGGRRGKILQADKGTLFLDEIGDMPHALQARLLRVLDARRVIPLGAEESVEVDFQLVSASHRDLEERVRAGLFREDLYFRLNGVSITLSPLRDRQAKSR
jgi:transcriptional regulator of acetoin/glycerol metabolism